MQLYFNRIVKRYDFWIIFIFLHEAPPALKAGAGKSFVCNADVITRCSVAACTASGWHTALRGKDHARHNSLAARTRHLRSKDSYTLAEERKHTTLISATSRQDERNMSRDTSALHDWRVVFWCIEPLWLITGTGCGCSICDWTLWVLSWWGSMFMLAGHATRHVHEVDTFYQLGCCLAIGNKVFSPKQTPCF